MVEELRSGVESAGIAAPLAFIAAYAVLTILLVPGTVITVLAGVLFGPLWGTVFAVAGATLGSVGAFEIARAVGRRRIAGRLGGRLAEAERRVAGGGLRAVLALRLTPVVPFNVLNYALGLSAVSRRDHLIGTAVGIIPATAVIVVLGAAALSPGSPAFFAALAIGGFVLWRALRRRPTDATTTSQAPA